ncbi:MAG: hypothetical protein IPJ88_18955 [Myxococcales bacterium]|nr:MAG: hypothetical protein IPJ88_18955 [Myxococcales bacterium]
MDAGPRLVLIRRDAPLEFFRASRLPIRGERRATQWLGVAAFRLLRGVLVRDEGVRVLSGRLGIRRILPAHWLSTRATETSSTLSTAIAASASNGIGFYITLLYCIAVVVFGVARIRRRRTPYVFRQTLTLMLIQCLLLFVLPEILLPWFGRLGAWDDGIWKSIADALFPLADYDANGREYWRAYGFVLAWPLFVWNVFTAQPHTVWLIISCVQTFVIIPSSSGVGVRGRTADGSARAERSRRRWGTGTARRCLTAEGGTG